MFDSERKDGARRNFFIGGHEVGRVGPVLNQYDTLHCTLLDGPHLAGDHRACVFQDTGQPVRAGREPSTKYTAK